MIEEKVRGCSNMQRFGVTEEESIGSDGGR